MALLETYPSALTTPEPEAPAQIAEAPARTAGEPSRRWRWTGDDLIRMGEVGLLPHEGRFELLDGEIYQLMPPGPLHATIVDLIGDLLEAPVVSLSAHVREEKPIRLNPGYEPQPDLFVARGESRDYRGRFPGPEDLLLVVEVADSSLDYDRKQKVPAYAAAGIPECWLVNLSAQQVEVYREPSAEGYRSLRLYRSGEVVAPLFAPESPLPVGGLLGQSPAEGAE